MDGTEGFPTVVYCSEVDGTEGFPIVVYCVRWVEKSPKSSTLASLFCFVTQWALAILYPPHGACHLDMIYFCEVVFAYGVRIFLDYANFMDFT